MQVKDNIIITEILTEIFSHLNPTQLTQSARGVSKFWKDVADTESFWQRACHAQNIKVAENEDPKAAYIKWYQLAESYFFQENLSEQQFRSVKKSGKIKLCGSLEIYKNMDDVQNFYSAFIHQSYIFEIKLTKGELFKFQFKPFNYIDKKEAYLLTIMNEFSKNFIRCYERVASPLKFQILIDNQKSLEQREKPSDHKSSCHCGIS